MATGTPLPLKNRGVRKPRPCSIIAHNSRKRLPPSRPEFNRTVWGRVFHRNIRVLTNVQRSMDTGFGKRAISLDIPSTRV